MCPGDRRTGRASEEVTLGLRSGCRRGENIKTLGRGNGSAKVHSWVPGWAYTRHREKPVKYDEGKGKRPRTSGQSGRPVLKDLKKNMNTVKERKR